jgi:RNA polymerase sigma-70 factor (sigma-E family)
VTELQQSFEAFYAAESGPCLRALLVLTGDRALAEDLAAEAFARAYARWPAVARHPNPVGWVMRTALNLRVTWWRRRWREAPWSDAPEASADSPVGDELGLARLLADLPLRQRQVLTLRALLDLDTRQTAEALGISEGSVTTHLHRGCARLRTRLTDTRS